MKKTAIITGAGGGLGKELTSLFIGEGYRVIGIDIIPGTAADHTGAGSFEYHRLDVTNPEQIGSFARDFGHDKGLDLLICLAGVYDTFPVTEKSSASITGMFQVNVFSVAFFIQAFLKQLIRNKGRVIVVSSESHKIQAMFQPYMVTKSALEAYCRAAWQELSLKGVGLSVIRPGAINTSLLSWMDKKGLPYPSVYENEFRISLETSKSFVKKIAFPAQVAETILRVTASKKPRRIYLVNNNPLLSVISLLPTRLLDLLIVSMIKRKARNR